MIKREFDAETQILKVFRSGSVTFEEIIEHINDIGKHAHLLPRDLKILTYGFQSHLSYPVNKQKIYIDEVLRYLNRFDSVKQAILMDIPEDVAFSLLFETLSEKIPKFHYKTFCSERDAIDWLNH